MIRAVETGLRDEARDLALLARRRRQLTALMLAILVLLGFRFGQLQLGEHEQYAARAESNRIRLQAVPPNRGLILDRHGRVLAENLPAYRLVVVPERTPDLSASLDAVDALVGLPAEDRERFEQQRRRSRPFEPVILLSSLDEAQVAVLAVNRHRLPGLEIEAYLTRHYPHDELLAHVIGYVSRLDVSDLERLNRDNYRGTTHTGKTGIERYYEDVLHGRTGFERVETNAQGRVIRVLERVDPEPGRDLWLNLDLDLQRAAAEALDGYAGGVVALDAATGEVLVMLSQPGFDPNLFVHGVGRDDYRRLLESSRRPLFNRVLAGTYEPGSTIKPFLALAGLDARVIRPETRVFSTGWYRLPGHNRRYRDWREGGHGWVDLELALEESVNAYFYRLAADLGIDRIARELALFGFGQPTGIDLPGERQGVLPTRSWKRAALDEPWFPGETVILGIGQGYISATPLQLAHATAALAGRGMTPPPRLADIAEPVRMVEHRPEYWDAVFAGLRAVVHGNRGTAREIARTLPVPAAGKTGTAQVIARPDDDDRRSDPEDLPEHLRHHALFTAFAPADAPRIVIAVVVEHGGGGARVAAPVAAAVLRQALENGW